MLEDNIQPPDDSLDYIPLTDCSKTQAIEYYQQTLGWIIIPLGKQSDGKAPMCKDWQKLTSPLPVVEVARGTNIGVLCGKASGITVIDIDKLKGTSDLNRTCGLEFWEAVEAKYGKFNTPSQNTPSGGRHLFFEYCAELKT